MKNTHEERTVFIREEGEDDNAEKLSLIDIKAAIAKQSIPISELFSRQDIAVNRTVLELIHTAENKAKAGLESEIVILTKSNNELKAFKDKADVASLVEKCSALTDKDEATVEYVTSRMKSGRGVDLSGNLSDAERQAKVDEAIAEELQLIKDQGITFKKPAADTDDNDDDFSDDPDNVKKADMSKAENNPLIPASGG